MRTPNVLKVPAHVAGTTRHPKMVNTNLENGSFFPVSRVGLHLRVLIPVINTPKLSAKTINREHVPGQYSPRVSRNRRIVKGDFKGLPFFMLTLVERETCPVTCDAWAFCYGDNSAFINRYSPELQAFKTALMLDLETLEKKRGSFVVRLHELGDFPNVEYVNMWGKFMRKHAGLHVFGYTHTTGKISEALDRLQSRYPERWRIMQSDISSETARPYTLTDTPEHRERFPEAFNGDAVPCPEQTGKTASCSTCGLCMNGKTNVIFNVH